MRFITIPQPTIVEDFDGTPIPVSFQGDEGYKAGTPWTMAMYLRHFVFGDTRFGGSPQNSESAFRIRRAFRIHREPGAIVTLDDRDWTLLAEIIEKPANPQPGVIAAAMWLHMEAILQAAKELPAPTPVAPPPAPTPAA